MASSTKSVHASLEGKVAIVSGSSSGIGAAIVRELAARGASVVINYPGQSEKENADAVLKSLAHPSRSIAIEADLSTLEGPKSLAEAAKVRYGKVDILINNAGVMIGGPLDDPDDARIVAAWDKSVNLNGRGTYLLTRAVLKILNSQNSRIINISSGSSRTPAFNQSMYAGTKGMLESLTRNWAKELPRKYGCTVNTVAPGVIGTEGYYAAPHVVREILKPFIDETPVAPRVGTTEEVAWTVAMLCEEGASWINGAYVPVGGGATMS
jgi:NAD(P)-dependent dehydrogenase (short-subunit alcohol dehydrogenase family)